MKNLKIKHIRKTYNQKTKSGAWSKAKKNIDIEEKNVSIEFFKKFTSEENIQFFNNRVQRTYELIGYVPTTLTGITPDGRKIVDKFIIDKK